MTKKPFFTIFIPTYNRSDDLRFAIFCILRQSFSDFEIVVIDNCSTDKTKSVISRIKNKKIRYYRNKKNLGFYSSAKKGIAKSRGKYIFLHGDDDFILLKTALEDVYKKIKEINPGYIRVNYLSRTPDKKKLFRFGLPIFFDKDKLLKSAENNYTIWNFINRTDPYFISGIIFKNSFPQDIKIIETEPIPWIKILLYNSKKLGAYHIFTPLIIASWSVWSPQKGYHPVYSLRKGRLASENLYEVMKQFLNKKDYANFLKEMMMGVYVNLFPVIKMRKGNKNLISLSKRIRQIDNSINFSSLFWAYFIFSLILPRFFLIAFRYIYFYVYTRFSRVNNDKQIIGSVQELMEDYHIYQR